MKRLQKLSAGVGALFLFMLLSIMGSASQCGAEGLKNANSSTLEPTKIKLTWETEGKVSQIRIFRINRGNKSYTWKKVAVLKGKKKSYVDTVKYNKKYRYEIAVYQKKGKKYERVGSDFCFASSCVSEMEWDEYVKCAKTTTEEIPLQAHASKEGLMPNGYEVYRSTYAEDFKCIDTVDEEVWQEGYADRTVEAHRTYDYKVRGFRTIHGKKYYSEFSSVMSFTAANSEGTYSAKVLTEEGDNLSSLVVFLSSDADNGDFIFMNEWLFGIPYGSFANETSSNHIVWTRYSYDGKNWISPGKDGIVLKAGQSMFIEFTPYEEDDILSYHRGEKAKVYIDGKYNANLDYNLSMDLNQLTASASLDWDYYYGE